MRKTGIIPSLMVLMMIVLASSCTNPDKSEMAIKKITSYNTKLPITFGNEDVLDSVYYDVGGHNAVFNYVVNDDAVTLESLSSNVKAAKEHILNQITSDTTVLNMYKDFAVDELNVRTVLLTPRSHVNVPVELSWEEIQALHPKRESAAKKSEKALTARDSLDQLIDSINALCPDSIDRNTELTKVQIENNYLVYNYVSEETKNSTIDIKKGEFQKRRAIADGKLRKPSPEYKQLIYLCIDNGLGIKHRYVGKLTKQAQDFAFSAVDLSKITRHPLPEGYEAVKERIKEPKVKRILAPGEKKREEGIY